MRLPDVNVLIYAHREDAPEHERYAAWLLAVTEADEPFAVSEAVLASVIRIVTNPKIFDPPSPMATAIAFCQRLIDWPRAVTIVPTRRHWDIFTGLCSNIHGPLVADAYLAAELPERVRCALLLAGGFEPRLEFLGGLHGHKSPHPGVA